LFRGVNNISLDAKGRMAIPTRFRESLRSSCASQLVITVDTDRCLLIYPLPEWQEIERKLVKFPSLNKVARDLQRMLMGNATDVEMDGQGRILIPTTLRDYAGLERKAVMIGQGHKFELWNEESWNSRLNEWQETDLEQLELPAGLETFSL